ANCIKCTDSNDWSCLLCEDCYYKADGNCFPCFSGCASCNGYANGNCFSCKNGFRQDRNYCYPCATGCKTCFGDLDKQCDSCLIGYTYRDHTCTQCPDNCIICTPDTFVCLGCTIGYYIRTGKCVACLTNSLTCDGTSGGVSYSCVEGYYLSYGNCIQCYEGCITCSTTEAGKCYSCEPFGYYFNNRACLSCSTSCYSYEYSATNCTSCKDGNYYFFNNTCLQCSNCAKGACHQNGCTQCSYSNYYVSGYNCLPCHSNRTTCEGISTNCTSCEIGQKYLKNNQCLQCKNCLSGYCLQSGCAVCTNNNYFAIDYDCFPCDEICKTCSKSSSQCTSCEDGDLHLKNSTCVPCLNCVNGNCHQDGCSLCIDSHYFNISHDCFKCDDNCKTCGTNKTNCLSCENGKYLDEGTCKFCDVNCLDNMCDVVSGCTACPEIFEVKNKVCMCKSGFYLSGKGVCSRCFTNQSYSNYKICKNSDEILFTQNCEICYEPFVQSEE
ncbi:hypothetical protein EIN_395890, partial [Entamoeba invadens IP1]